MEIIEESRSHTINYITAYDAQGFSLSQKQITESTLLSPSQHAPWRPTTLSDITPDDWTLLLDWKPELVLIGTGKHFQPLPDALAAPLFEHGISVEAMSNAILYATFNTLAIEGRSVAAAILIKK